MRAACDEAFAKIDAIEDQLSIYRPFSEISRINRLAAMVNVIVDPETFNLLQRASQLCYATNSAFDVTIGALIDLWASCKTQIRVPLQEEIDTAMKYSGNQCLELNSSERSVRFAHEGVKINLGAYGKGYAVDAAADVLLLADLPGALIHSGYSTVMAIGSGPDRLPWRVGIRSPQHQDSRVAEVSLQNQTMSTSGNYEQYFECEGRRFGHVIDPRTGWPVNSTLSATIICQSAAVSDAISTAAMVLGEVEANKILSSQHGIQSLLYSANIAR